MKILYVTTISLTMNSFFKPHIEMLVREGHSVDIACNYKDLALDKFYSELGCGFFQIDFSRSPLSGDNVRAYGQLKKLVEEGRYDIVHCHTPNAAVVTRLACRKLRKSKGLKVFYTAHGFHFFKGAPLKNWLIYFPAEWLCSYMTDTLITINEEDYALAKNRMHAKKIEHVPGVGIDIERFENVSCDRAEVRSRVGVPEDAIMLLSVGELNDNKNHQIVIRALGEIASERNIHYLIAGEGTRRAALLELAKEYGLAERVHLAGYCRDVSDLYSAADVFVFPSYREGLSVSLMEAMSHKLPCIASKIRGNVDLIDNNGGCLFDPYNIDEIRRELDYILNCDKEKMGQYNFMRMKKFSLNSVIEKMKLIYGV